MRQGIFIAPAEAIFPAAFLGLFGSGLCVCSPAFRFSLTVSMVWNGSAMRTGLTFLPSLYLPPQVSSVMLSKFGFWQR